MLLKVDSSSDSCWTNSSGEQTCMGKLKGWLLDPTMPGAAHTLGGLIRSVKGLVEPFFEIADNISAGIGGTQFTAVFLLPAGLYELWQSVKGIFTNETGEGKFDSFLSAVGGVSEGAECVANIAEGLVSVGSVAYEAVAWAGPLGLAAAGLSGIFIAIHAKAIHSNHCVLKGIKKAKHLSTDKSIEKLQKKKCEYRLESSAGVDVKQVITKINTVKGEKDGENKVKEIYKALKTRIKEKQACHALGIVITVIGIVAAAILFATALTPWVIAGFALLAGLYILCMSRLAVGLNSDRKINQLLAMPS